jgi:hypothetical protein
MIKNIDILINGLYGRSRAPGAALPASKPRKPLSAGRPGLVRAHQNGDPEPPPPPGETAPPARARRCAPGGEMRRNFSAFMRSFSRLVGGDKQ